MTQCLLTVENVAYAYNPKAQVFQKTAQYSAIHNLSFVLKEGDRLGIIGANGSGKSTLLKLLAGVIPPSAGTIKYLPNMSKMLLALGGGLDNYLTGRDNAILAMMLQGVPARVARERMEEVKAFSELGDFFEKPVKSYSNGMRSKLAFSVATLAKVDILLIDEVLSVGDSIFRQKARKALLARVKEQSATVFVSHNPGKVQRICNRVIWLEQGSIRAESDNVTEVLDQYREATKATVQR